jgi:hypothetical protein
MFVSVEFVQCPPVIRDVQITSCISVMYLIPNFEKRFFQQMLSFVFLIDYFKGTAEAQLANRFVSNRFSDAGPFVHRFVQPPPRLPFHPGMMYISHSNQLFL